MCVSVCVCQNVYVYVYAKMFMCVSLLKHISIYAEYKGYKEYYS